MAQDQVELSTFNRILGLVKDRSPYWQAIHLLIFSALLMLYLVSFLKASEDWSQLIDRIVISLGFFILLFALVFREITRIRKEKYANIQEDIHHIQHIIRDQMTILRVMEGKPRQEIELHSHVVFENTRDCLNRLASVFSLLTGTKCRASIKLIEPGLDPDKPVVYTFLRDVDSERFFDEDDERRRSEGKDLLELNTDFKSVFGESGRRWFFCNDLPSRQNYINSRDPNLGERDLTGFRGVWNVLRPVDWKLPYRSCIVWPIRQKQLKPTALGEEFNIVGFLTVDSGHRRVFDERYDTHLGAGVADALHSMFVRLTIVGDEGEQK